MSEPEQSIDQTIAAAVNARVEAAVFKALSGDETIGAFVAAALNEPITKEDRNYRRRETTYLAEKIRAAIQKSSDAVVQQVIDEEIETVRAAVRKTVRKNVNQIADAFTDSLTSGGHSFLRVSIELPKEYV